MGSGASTGFQASNKKKASDKKVSGSVQLTAPHMVRYEASEWHNAAFTKREAPSHSALGWAASWMVNMDCYLRRHLCDRYTQTNISPRDHRLIVETMQGMPKDSLWYTINTFDTQFGLSLHLSLTLVTAQGVYNIGLDGAQVQEALNNGVCGGKNPLDWTVGPGEHVFKPLIEFCGDDGQEFDFRQGCSQCMFVPVAALQAGSGDKVEAAYEKVKTRMPDYHFVSCNCKDFALALIEEILGYVPEYIQNIQKHVVSNGHELHEGYTIGNHAWQKGTQYVAVAGAVGGASVLTVNPAAGAAAGFAAGAAVEHALPLMGDCWNLANRMAQSWPDGLKTAVGQKPRMPIISFQGDTPLGFSIE